MPKSAQKFTVDLKQKKLFIDGEEFPWHTSIDGPTITKLGVDDIHEVTVTILACDVEVIPET